MRVLLLGRDTGRSLQRLNRIKRVVEQQGLACVLIKDQRENPIQGLISKVILHAALARYVIIENSYASGHLYELPFVREAESIIVLLQECGRGASRMTDDMIPKHRLIRRFWYQPDTIGEAVRSGMKWAEERVTKNRAINRSSWAWITQRSKRVSKRPY